ncbi:zinc ribbon domain-containing protein [Paraburkholderia madseniana]|uniref:Zinc ribbon domain-containing protein n=1 Tax=Paraburkholderia madseniana TaxID=2599607 RepID=A0AAP5BIT4_9BURK|nr:MULTISPECIES: FmdB family zinc ribbon protein [Paraburkholderia]MCX4148930.1 zinc ribbon domain-containing protein [Paraburkholderia madseniana]MDN7151867.1 zinc ribbon domain-containing protein [Paraburkholderia sp. WS6]MDQ6410747.1 zinc ribbon domain-containing protein [Paraburkholderia madseniana]
MPIYEYACDACGTFDSIRPVARRDERTPCPDCGLLSPRIASGATVLLAQRGETMPAEEGAYGFRHQGGCGCCR